MIVAAENEMMSSYQGHHFLWPTSQAKVELRGTLFPITLADPIPADHICRMSDAFVDTLAMSQLGFERAEAVDTGRPGYDPRDLLKLYLYGYLNQIRSSRRLEAESKWTCKPMVLGFQSQRLERCGWLQPRYTYDQYLSPTNSTGSPEPSIQG